jgi:hypothetical protein
MKRRDFLKMSGIATVVPLALAPGISPAKPSPVIAVQHPHMRYAICCASPTHKPIYGSTNSGRYISHSIQYDQTLSEGWPLGFGLTIKYKHSADRNECIYEDFYVKEEYLAFVGGFHEEDCKKRADKLFRYMCWMDITEIFKTIYEPEQHRDVLAVPSVGPLPYYKVDGYPFKLESIYINSCPSTKTN